MKENCILLFLKAPVPEKMDSRLRQAFGAEKSCEVYMEMSRAVLDLAYSVENAQTVVVYDAHSKYPDLRWVDASDPGFLSPKGARVSEAAHTGMKWCFEAGAVRVVCLSALAPFVQRDSVAGAFGVLADSDIVIGPVQDGGWYLFGTRGVFPEIFEGYPWQGKNQNEEISSKAKELGLSVQSMDELPSVLDAKAYSQWKKDAAAKTPVK